MEGWLGTHRPLLGSAPKVGRLREQEMEIKINELEELEWRLISRWGKKHSQEGVLKVLPPAKFVKYIGIDLMPDYLFIFIRTVSSLLVLLYFSSWELRELLYDATVFSCLNTPDFFPAPNLQPLQHRRGPSSSRFISSSPVS